MKNPEVFTDFKQAWIQKETLKSNGINFQFQELKTMTCHYINGDCHSVAINEIYIITIIK